MRDLFGQGAPAKTLRRPRRQAKTSSKATSATSLTRAPTACADAVPSLTGAGLDLAAVESFCALGMAVCLESPAGIVWLVPRYTTEPRPEIRAADLAKLVLVRATFPGSRITNFSAPPPDPTSGASPTAHVSDARRSK